MILHVMPTYTCDTKCSYCYLGKERDKFSILTKEKLQEAVNEVDNLIANSVLDEMVTHIDLYGGDIFKIPVSYLKLSIIKPLLNHYPLATMNIIGIGNERIPYVTDVLMDDLYNEYGDRVYWSVSYNKERPDKNYTLQLLPMLKYQPKNALVVLFPKDVYKDPRKYLKGLNALHVKYITFLQYFPSDKNHLYHLSYVKFSLTMIKLLREYFENREEYQFEITNVEDLNAVINGTYNVYANEAIFIQPNGQIGFIDYKKSNGNIVEYFRSFKSYTDIDNFLNYEQQLYEIACRRCSIRAKYGCCYPEHLNDFALYDREFDACCGRASLIREYERLVEKYGINN